MSDNIILVGEQQVKGFALMQIRAKLRMEVAHPKGPKWRVSPAVQARSVLNHVGRPDPGRTKKKVLAAYEAYLTELGLPG